MTASFEIISNSNFHFMGCGKHPMFRRCIFLVTEKRLKINYRYNFSLHMQILGSLACCRYSTVSGHISRFSGHHEQMVTSSHRIPQLKKLRAHIYASSGTKASGPLFERSRRLLLAISYSCTV